MYNQNIIIEF